jgi:Na+-transporting methylmalonyl-CoA/oxaloacetate decarboxylase, beta subunit
MRHKAEGATLRLDELTELTLRQLFRHNSDVVIHRFYSESGPQTTNPIVIYCTGMIDDKQLNDFLYGQLRQLFAQIAGAVSGEAPINEQHLTHIEGQNAIDRLVTAVFSGNLVIFFDRSRTVIQIGMSKPPGRMPDESSTEISIKGPRDGFTEQLQTNIALIRKRLKTTSLAIEHYEIGRRTKTSLALLYMTDITNNEIVKEARHRIQSIDVDGLVSSQELETALSDHTYSLFPLINYIGRPDFAVECLLRGRFVITIDGNPMVLIAPANITSLIKSPEDDHSPFAYVSLERLLRITGLVIALLLPGFWVAVTAFNLDQIPFPLLATITMSRLGLPISGPVDIFLMLGMFELFREAGMRLPKAVGQTVAVVGGLIVGDAAISAGLTSPTTLVVTAVTSVSTFTLVNQSLSGTVSIIRFFVLTLSSLFGMLGFFVAMYLIVVYMSSLTSFGVSFLAPLSPISFKDYAKGIIALPWTRYNRRPGPLRTKEDVRQGDDS